MQLLNRKTEFRPAIENWLFGLGLGGRESAQLSRIALTRITTNRRLNFLSIVAQR